MEVEQCQFSLVPQMPELPFLGKLHSQYFGRYRAKQEKNGEELWGKMLSTEDIKE